MSHNQDINIGHYQQTPSFVGLCILYGVTYKSRINANLWWPQCYTFGGITRQKYSEDYHSHHDNLSNQLLLTRLCHTNPSSPDSVTPTPPHQTLSHQPLLTRLSHQPLLTRLCHTNPSSPDSVTPTPPHQTLLHQPLLTRLYHTNPSSPDFVTPTPPHQTLSHQPLLTRLCHTTNNSPLDTFIPIPPYWTLSHN